MDKKKKKDKEKELKEEKKDKKIKKDKDKAKDKAKDKDKVKKDRRKAEPEIVSLAAAPVNAEEAKPKKSKKSEDVAENKEVITKRAVASDKEFVLSRSLEDYLEKIYLLIENNMEARVTDIANELKLSKPSVNRAIATLAEQGYIDHDSYGDIILTDMGESIARNIYKKHNLLKKFLIEMLGVSEEIAEIESSHMGHYISADTTQRLNQFMKINKR